MKALYDRKSLQAIDRHAIENLGIPELVLMEHAALSAAARIIKRFGTSPACGIAYAGPGNNGADAVAAARILHLKGYPVRVRLVGDPKKLQGSARIQWEAARKLGISCEAVGSERCEPVDWVLDGIFGIGLDRPLEGTAAKVVDALNAHQSWVLALDIPSGLCADTGRILGTAVRACETVTFGFLKRGLVTGQGPDCTGEIFLDEIQIPRSAPIPASCFLMEDSDARAWLPERRPTSHKGTFGHVYVWAGAPQTQGASALSALGALRAGAGLSTVVAPGSDGGADLRARLRPEIMCRPFDPSLLQPHPSAAWVVGPGMGLDAAAAGHLKRLFESPLTLVVDGDALTLIAERPQAYCARKAPTVFTPHPKEAARLLGSSVSEVEADRYQALCLLREKFAPAVILLKGHGTLVSDGPNTWVVRTGNSTQAKGGSGDVLSGLVAGFLAQGLAPSRAAALGSFVHGRAAQWLSQRQGTERSALASEVVDVVDRVFNELEEGT